MKTIDLRPIARPLLAVCLAIVIGAAWLAPFDTPANAVVDAGLKRALVSFAGARALDALISVAQGTEVAVQPDVHARPEQRCQLATKCYGRRFVPQAQMKR